jgi:hypothetical protein
VGVEGPGRSRDGGLDWRASAAGMGLVVLMAGGLVIVGWLLALGMQLLAP